MKGRGRGPGWTLRTQKRKGSANMSERASSAIDHAPPPHTPSPFALPTFPTFKILLNSGMIWNTVSALYVQLFAPVGQSVSFNFSKHTWYGVFKIMLCLRKAYLKIFLTTCQQTYLSTLLERAGNRAASWSQKILWRAFGLAHSIKTKTPRTGE